MMQFLANTVETRYRCWQIHSPIPTIPKAGEFVGFFPADTNTYFPDHACQVLLWLVDVQGNDVPQPQLGQYTPPEQRGPNSDWITVFGKVERPHPCKCFAFLPGSAANGCMVMAWSFLPQHELGSAFWHNSVHFTKPMRPDDYYENVLKTFFQLSSARYNWTEDTKMFLLATISGDVNDITVELMQYLSPDQWQQIVVSPQYDPGHILASALEAALIAFRDKRLIRALGSEQAFLDSTMQQLHSIEI